MKYINRRWIIIMLFIVAGFLTGIQFKQDKSSSDIITIRSLYEEQKNIENEQIEITRLQRSLEEQSSKLQSYYLDDYDIEDIIHSLKQDLKLHRVFAGQEETEGPGIRILMEDSLQYEENQNENNFIIHNSDILQIINDLRGAEAERIAINGVPISWDTKIDCNGATIKVGNEIFAPPFIIEAIGKPESLENILLDPQGIIQLMRFWDIQISISKQEHILIRALPPSQEYKYLKIVEEEGDN